MKLNATLVAIKMQNRKFWLIETQSFKDFNGIKIPNESKVTWKFEEDDFHWLTVKITEIEYNVTKEN